jgi:hypothetical protein
MIAMLPYLYALVSTLALLAALVTLALEAAGMRPLAARAAACAAAGLALAPPIHPAAEIVSSLFTPYAPAVAIMALWYLVAPRNLLSRPPTWPEIAVVAAAAGAFYGMSLGATQTNPYAFFYDGRGAIFGSGAALALGLALRRPLIAALAPISFLTWWSGITLSENYADSLVHPVWLVMLTLGVALGRRSALPSPAVHGRKDARRPGY